MTRAPSLSALPETDSPRWQPLRLGLVELYHYDVEEFWFRDGHLLLRGNNGTGKSKVLSLTLPFLFDADLSAARVEPDGDRNKRMDWNLLMGGRHDRRIGYTWIEFGRRNGGGELQTLTLGCGLRAVAGRGSVEPWFFITDQRIGVDLWLTTAERTVLSRERLAEAIGTRGQVFRTARDYRRAVDERLFRLGTERYAALVDTLIQLRQPQLSKQPNEQRLSDALTEALPPLDRAALEDVAEAMGQLEDFRRELEELSAMSKAVATFGRRYRRYAQVATRRRARVLRQAQTEFDNASRDLQAAEGELERARAVVEQVRNREQALEEQLVADRARQTVLQADPAMRDARRLDDATEHARRCAAGEREATERLKSAQARLDAETTETAARTTATEGTHAQLVEINDRATRLAVACGVGQAHEEALGAVAIPDGVAEAPGEFPDGFLRQARELERRRHEQIELLHRRLRALAEAEQAHGLAREARDQRADAFAACTQASSDAAEQLQETSLALVTAWRRHGTGLRVLTIRDADEALDALMRWVTTVAGQNPMAAALDDAERRHEAALAQRHAELGARRKALQADQSDLESEQARLEAGQDQPPPVPYTRDEAARRVRPGAPLWQLVDFAPQVPEPARAGIEAALESAGLLDAWVTPDGRLLDTSTHDVVLVARHAYPAPLADWLVPSIPATGPAAAVDPRTVSALLRAITCTESEPDEADAWVSPSGEFRIGPRRGAWAKSRACYIGYAARESARRTRLRAIRAELARIHAALAACETEAAEIAELRRRAREERDGAPSDQPLLRKHAEYSAAERCRREAQDDLGKAEARLIEAARARTAATEALDQDARDLRLPADAKDLARTERALADYGISAVELASALRDHQRASVELARQRLREGHAHDDHLKALADREEKQARHREALEIVNALQASVGKKVDQLLAELGAVRISIETNEKECRRARAELNMASSRRGTAENACQTQRARLQERIEARQQSVEGLQRYAVETGLLSVALPDIELPGTASWGIEAALNVARRAEQALTDLSAENSDWDRISRDIGRDLTELQSAMSVHGHAATAEPTDYGLIVRIEHNQRAVRPDELERRLEAELAERRQLLTAQERAVLEDHLEKEIASSLQRMIQNTERHVAAINQELGRRPTSTGVRFRLDWQVRPEDSQHGVPGLIEARKRLLKTSADAWSPADRRQVGEFLRARIDAERERDDQATLYESLARALDYRHWHQYRVQRLQDGSWRPLSGPASSGERALGLTVPLFAAASSHYQSADPHAPRLVLLDEAFAGIDDEARASCMALIREFDLDFVMTSEREWGCYAELPGLSICQVVRREGMDAVYVSRWTWDGNARVAEEDRVQRFPEIVEQIQ